MQMEMHKVTLGPCAATAKAKARQRAAIAELQDKDRALGVQAPKKDTEQSTSTIWQNKNSYSTERDAQEKTQSSLNCARNT